MHYFKVWTNAQVPSNPPTNVSSTNGNERTYKDCLLNDFKYLIRKLEN